MVDVHRWVGVRGGGGGGEEEGISVAWKSVETLMSVLI